MVSTLSMVTAILVVLYVGWSTADYEKWEDLPSCAQDCLMQAVNASLAGCSELSLDCFCQNGFATVAFDICLASDSQCGSDPVKTDSEDFQSNVLCNLNTDSGFRFTTVKSTETVTLGLGADSGEETITVNTDQERTTTSWTAPSSSSSGSSPATVSASATSPAYATPPVATRSTPGVITSISTVIIELSSDTPTSITTAGASTGAAVTTVVVVAAASTPITSMLVCVSSLLTTWVLAFTPDTFGWP
ncbi:hypothetical protein CLCR_00497 [Cladophialophora carrionii]|uniref:CFEM domain-containing protein n=1 Tax=Cladophialophora carrionii TaxID=86049 RepID=A0A1C1CBV3_9EURO|nr:hypothetical protein CLCR_00497 [Cladophialophora carrionii]